jgi:hypothetical protein
MAEGCSDSSTVGLVSEITPPRRRGRLLRFTAALFTLLAVTAYLVIQHITGGGGAPDCTVVAAGQAGNGPAYHFSPEQAANAATISAVGTTRGMPERAVTIALATALQESGLRNLDHGDRDSLGLFQQRPSKGWGSAAQILDPAYAARQFYVHLAKVPGYSRLPLTVAAQRVQRSGFPQAYAKHEPDATLLTAALTGRAGGSLTCSLPQGSTAGDPAEVRAALVRDFGSGVLPGAPAAGKDTGAAAAELSVPVMTTEAARTGDSGDPPDTAQRGWELAQWAVAQTSALHIDEVSYAGRVWSVKDSGSGWQRAPAGGAEAAGTGAGDVQIHIAQ